MKIADRRRTVLEGAEKNNGFLKDKHGNFLQLDPVRYKDDIAELTRLFDSIPFRDKLFNQGRALSLRASHILKSNPDVQNARHAWPQLIDEEKATYLADISKLMIDILNGSECWLSLNYPQLALARFPASELVIGMQVQETAIPRSADADDKNTVTMTLISINRDCPAALQNFDDAVTMLWHEHMHMYMSGMREGLKGGFLKQNHPLFKDIYNSKTIKDYPIMGNFLLAASIYYAEPEEKFCYAAQTVFHSAFNQKPATEMRQQYA